MHKNIVIKIVKMGIIFLTSIFKTKIKIMHKNIVIKIVEMGIIFFLIFLENFKNQYFFLLYFLFLYLK